LPEARVVGISDEEGYLHSPQGLPVDELVGAWRETRLVTRRYYRDHLEGGRSGEETKFSTCPDDLLRESAICLIPAAPIANYLDVDPATHPCMTTDRIGRWLIVVEGANTYSPIPSRRQARARMERSVYRQAGCLIATDYLVNSGGVIFAAQERLIRTPDHLRIPQGMLGDGAGVEAWVRGHAGDLAELARQRREAGEAWRDQVIRRNMREVVERLANDADLLPCEAAESIAIGRIATSEGERKAAEVMAPIPTTCSESRVQQAAAHLVEAASPILAVVSPDGTLAGVVTEWDITRAAATRCAEDATVDSIMTRDVITADPSESVLEVVRRLEYYGISALPVVERGAVVGMISADLLARRTLLRLLQSQSADSLKTPSR
jgi:glutamate dehydrogenase (NAD(P)+)